MNLFEEVMEMEEPATYQWLIAKGEVKGQIAMLVRQGKWKFKQEPDETARMALEAITDSARLERLGERLFEVDSWRDLLRQN